MSKRLDEKKYLIKNDKTLHTEKYFRNLIKSNRNQIGFTIFRLIWNTNGQCLFAVQYYIHISIPHTNNQINISQAEITTHYVSGVQVPNEHPTKNR